MYFVFLMAILCAVCQLVWSFVLDAFIICFYFLFFFKSLPLTNSAFSLCIPIYPPVKALHLHNSGLVPGLCLGQQLPLLQLSYFKQAAGCFQPLSPGPGSCRAQWRYNCTEALWECWRCPSWSSQALSKHSCPPKAGLAGLLQNRCRRALPRSLANCSSRVTEISVPSPPAKKKRAGCLEWAGCRTCRRPAKSAALGLFLLQLSWPDPRTAPQPGSQLLLSGWKSELTLEEAGAGIWRRPLGSDSLAARHVHWQRHKTTSLPQKSRQPELLQLNMDREVNAACCWQGNVTCHDWGEKAKGGDELYQVPEIDPLLWRLGFCLFVCFLTFRASRDFLTTVLFPFSCLPQLQAF